MLLNILTGKTGEKAKNAIESSEELFWKFVLNTWRVRYNLTDKTIEVFSKILTLDHNVSYFSGKGSEYLRSITKNLSQAELSRIKKILLNSGLVVESSNGRGEAYPVNWLTVIAEKFRNNEEIQIIAPFISKKDKS